MAMDEYEIKKHIESLRREENLPSPPSSPVPPEMHTAYNTKQKVFAIQKFIESFQYNYTGQPFVRMQKNRGMHHIALCAKQIIREALPIQCVEAVFLGCLLTAGLIQIDRVPLSFKSKHDTNTYRHIVLAIRYEGKWGALGISRRSNLMNKDIRFDSLSDMVEDYRRCYAKCGHRMVGVYLGLPFSHDVYSDMPIKWKVLKVKTYTHDSEAMALELNQFTINMGRMFEYFRREGSLPQGPSSRREQLPSFRAVKKVRRKSSKSMRTSTSREVLRQSTSSLPSCDEDGTDDETT
jgi:tubulinyl-Tyr carboxypeptidase